MGVILYIFCHIFSYLVILYLIKLDYNSICMIDFMLDDLCGPAVTGLDAVLHLHSLVLNLDRFIAFTRTRITEKRQSSLLGVIRTILFNDFEIEHHRVCRNSSALVEKSDNMFSHTNHIRYHADTAIFMCH